MRWSRCVICCTNSRAHIASSLLAVRSFLLLLSYGFYYYYYWIGKRVFVVADSITAPASLGEQPATQTHTRSTHQLHTLKRCTFTTNERIEKNLCWLGDFDCHCCTFRAVVFETFDTHNPTKRFKFLLSFRSHSISFSPLRIRFSLSICCCCCCCWNVDVSNVHTNRLPCIGYFVSAVCLGCRLFPMRKIYKIRDTLLQRWAY